MKALSQPRAVLATSQPGAQAALVDALRRVDVEGYPASGLASAAERAARQDTIMVVLEVAGQPLEPVLEAIATIRREPKSADVLVAVFSGELDEAAREQLYAAGANAVEAAPVTPASALNMLLRLAKRPRQDGAAAAPAAGEHDPLETLKAKVLARRSRHKIFLGAAPGVGKTFAMLHDAQDARERGEEVVVGLVETHNRKDTAAALAGLEIVPRRCVDYKGTTLEEMDLDGILARRPAMVLVDELAHTNVPGSLNKKRYEDVNVLRLAGIPVVSTMNIQHMESLNNVVERITGVKVRETVPDTVLEEADEVVLVDISPDALQQRLKAGKIYAEDKVTQSLANFFTTHNLTALRELVLRELANRVDETLEEVRANIGKAEQPTGIQDRLLACITPTEAAARIIRRAARIADRLDAELVVLHVETTAPNATERAVLAQHEELTASLDASFIKLREPEPGEAIARYAARNGITLVLLGETHLTRWQLLKRRPMAELILANTANIDVIIVATHT